MNAFRKTRGEDLFKLSQMIDGVTVELPRLIFDSPVWCSFVHAVNSELGYRRNKVDLARQRGTTDSADMMIGFGGAAPAIELAEDVHNAEELIAYARSLCAGLTRGQRPDETELVEHWVSGVENLIVRAQRG